MKKRTKALDFTQEVKARIYERDGWCIWCGDPQAYGNAHYIPRSQGGIGIEENGLTLCPRCHMKYDQSPDRQKMREFFRAYLTGKYPGWDESNLIFRK